MLPHRPYFLWNALWAMGAVTLRISELCFSWSPHPNISDRNFQHGSSFYSHPNITDTFLEPKWTDLFFSFQFRCKLKGNGTSWSSSITSRQKWGEILVELDFVFFSQRVCKANIITFIITNILRHVLSPFHVFFAFTPIYLDIWFCIFWFSKFLVI